MRRFYLRFSPSQARKTGGFYKKGRKAIIRLLNVYKNQAPNYCTSDIDENEEDGTEKEKCYLSMTLKRSYRVAAYQNVERNIVDILIYQSIKFSSALLIQAKAIGKNLSCG